MALSHTNVVSVKAYLRFLELNQQGCGLTRGLNNYLAQASELNYE